MLGFGRGPEILETRQIEDSLLLAIGDLEIEEEAWLITPYLTIDKLSSLRRQITEACRRGATVNVVVRDEPNQVDPARSGFDEAISNGLNLYAFHRLHAKVYWFEGHSCIVTSANLVDGSFEGSTEIGVISRPGALYDQARKWITETVEPGLKVISKRHPVRRGSPRAKTVRRSTTKRSSEGLCIRCAAPIPLNVERPYCLKDYRAWEQYGNPFYEEQVCHSCGKPARTSMEKPLCYECYKKHLR